MVTILLEIKRNDGIQGNEFYNPAIDGFKKYPRTELGIKKAVIEMFELIKDRTEIADYRLKIYDGKYEYWKNISPLYIIDSMGNISA